MKNKIIVLLLAVIVTLLLLTACQVAAEMPDYEKDDIPVVEASPEEEADGQLPEDPLDGAEQAKEIAARVKANETGKVMVLMYHVIGSEAEGDWKQTADNFRRDLQTLYDEGYSLIDLLDFVENEISVPAGRTPVVLTFDDGSAGHFRYLENQDGTVAIDPECAVGIMLNFAEQHPEFGLKATFYVNAEPFGQRQYWQAKLQELVSRGFSVGNHTYTHPKLSKLTDEQVQKELATLAMMVEQAVPGYQVRSLALPHGISPQKKELAQEGVYQDYAYRNSVVLKVGAEPAVSPVNKGFDPLRLPRVQASSAELEKWLEYFRKRPEERYISDGNPATVSLPQGKEELIDREKVGGGKEIIIY